MDKAFDVSTLYHKHGLIPLFLIFAASNI